MCVCVSQEQDGHGLVESHAQSRYNMFSDSDEMWKDKQKN